MEALVQQIFGGLATGGIYASLALALVMIYRSTHLINFAQGEMAMFSTYLAWSLVDAGWPYPAAFAATVLLSMLIGVLVERLVIRPVEDAPHLTLILVFIGLLVLFNSVAGLVFGHAIKTFPSPFGRGPSQIPHLSMHEMGTIGITVVVLAFVYGFFRFTSLGLAMRAVAENPVSCRLVGIRVSWMLALGWGLAAAIGAIAGMLVAPVTYLDPNMMSGVLLYALAGALLGGIDNPWGAVVGGFLVGLLENLAGAYLVGPDLKLPTALVLIVAVLTVSPSGLFGRTRMVRV